MVWLSLSLWLIFCLAFLLCVSSQMFEPKNPLFVRQLKCPSFRETLQRVQDLVDTYYSKYGCRVLDVKPIKSLCVETTYPCRGHKGVKITFRKLDDCANNDSNDGVLGVPGAVEVTQYFEESDFVFIAGIMLYLVGLDKMPRHFRSYVESPP